MEKNVFVNYSKYELSALCHCLFCNFFPIFQQLQCTVVGKESARRYFEAVQGHGDSKGELFGIKNLFRLQTQGTCLTRKILEVKLPTDISLFY